MTVKDVLEYVDDLYENPFDEQTKLIWINQIEAEIQAEVLLLAMDGIVQYEDQDLFAELIAPPPFDKIYPEYLIWRIMLAQEETERANNQQIILDEAWKAYARFVAETVDPGSGLAETLRYYISAYQVSVKHGYTGTEAEWVKSLKGDKGDTGETGARGPAGNSFDVEYDPDTGTVSVVNGDGDGKGDSEGDGDGDGDEAPAYMKADTYDPDGAVAAAGGIANYVRENMPDTTPMASSDILTVNVTNHDGTLSADKTYAEIQTAAQAGKLVQARYEGNTYMLGYADPNDVYVDFNHMWGRYLKVLEITNENAVRYVVMAFTTA